MLVLGYDCIGLAAFHGERHDLVGELAALLGGRRFHVGIERKFVLRRAADLIVPAQVLGRLDHAARNRVELAARRIATAREAIMQHQAFALDIPAHIDGEERRVRHAFGPARNDKIIRAGRYLHHAIDHGLKAGAAAPVDLVAAGRGCQAGIERHHPAECRRFHGRIALRKQAVLDSLRRQLRARHQFTDDMARHIVRMDRLERAAKAADCRANRLADYNISHGVFLLN